MAITKTPRYEMQKTIAKLEDLGVVVDHKFSRNEEFKMVYTSNDDNDYCIAIPKEQLFKIDLNNLPNFWKYDDMEYGVRGLTLSSEKFKDKPMVLLKFKIKR
jgi:hypothetical protein